ncbi:MAG: dihydroorotase [Clostridiales bacterium]|jgi:dihydroorotase|nr:dihydroorotase [Clostridiales bacterium]
MASILIKGGRVIDPANYIDGGRDLLIRDGIVGEVGENLSEDGADRVVDASGLIVVPGLIDLHVHFRQPGHEHKETIETGSRAAAMGGYTTVCAMPNTNPAVDNEVVVEYVKLMAARAGLCNVLPIGAATAGQKGERLSDIGSMARAGIVAVSEDGKSVAGSALLKTAMKYASQFGLPMFSHCEDADLAGSGQMNAGARAALLGLNGIPNDSEEVIVARDIILANATGCRLHVCHISTEGAVWQLRSAKSRQYAVTGEAAPHHFTLTDEDVPGDYDANFKMNPPLRSAADRAAVIRGLADGTIDCIATDHAPHHYDEKNVEFANAPNGVVGLETAFALAYTGLALTNALSPLTLIEKMSLNPARILGINRGALSRGLPADVSIFDTREEYAIDPALFASKARNTPFAGRRVRGRLKYTILGGKVVVDNGVIRD